MKKFLSIGLLAIAIIASPVATFAGNALTDAYNKKPTAIAPATFEGAAMIENVPIASDVAYDKIVNFLQKRDYSIDNAMTSKENGQIFTAPDVKGTLATTTTGVVIKILKEDAKTTTIKVAITKRSVVNAFNFNPSKAGKIDGAKSKELADQIKPLLVPVVATAPVTASTGPTLATTAK